MPSAIRSFFRSIDPKPAIKRYLRHKAFCSFYRLFIKKNDLCFDVGSNLGDRIDIFSAIGATVVAVEPQDSCMQYLIKKYHSNKNIHLIHSALDEKSGESTIHISPSTTISSMSESWIKNVKSSGRFSSEIWPTTQVVKTTTLDSLIAQFGMPSFIKIDVEGYEEQVLKGLSQRVKALSIEFTPEHSYSTIQCIQYLKTLGLIELNVSIGETLKFIYPVWLSAQEMINNISQLKSDFNMSGDIYIRFLS